MAKTSPLYALQRDLDMVTQDVEYLKKSYNLLDYIAKVARNSELEQLAQAAQMRRIEDTMKEIWERMDRMEATTKQIWERMDRMENTMEQMSQRMDRMENRMDRIENALLLICKHLGIQPA
jgi:methyl-accepting chemotaxis protein